MPACSLRDQAVISLAEDAGFVDSVGSLLHLLSSSSNLNILDGNVTSGPVFYEVNLGGARV